MLNLELIERRLRSLRVISDDLIREFEKDGIEPPSYLMPDLMSFRDVQIMLSVLHWVTEDGLDHRFDEAFDEWVRRMAASHYGATVGARS
jgi:hypothetical protein